MGTNCGKHLCQGKHDCGSCGVQQSKWEVRFIDDYIFKCANCGYVTDLTALGFTYCPNCGAKMDLEAEDV